MSVVTHCELEQLFPGDSEMAALMREVDWTRTPIGSPVSWPPELKVVIGICLTSPLPSLVWWGPKLTFFYNDVAAPILAKSYPQTAVGPPGSQSLPDLWPALESEIRSLFSAENDVWSKPVILALRNGSDREQVPSFSCSPIFDDTAHLGGVLCFFLHDDHGHIKGFTELQGVNGKLVRRVAEMEDAATVINNSRRAALNLMEDAISARAALQIEIEERKRTDMALRASEDRLRTLFESMSEAFVIKEAIVNEAGAVVDYRFIECNPAFSVQTGLEDPKGRTVLELMPDIEPIWLTNYEKVIQTGDPCQFEAHIGPLGRWLRVSASRIGGEGSLRVAIVFTDITKRRQAEEKIAAAEEQLRLVLESVREYAIFSTDVNRRITTWNKGAERLLYYTEQEILGQPADIIFTDEDQAAGACDQEVRTATEFGRATDERWHVRKDHTRFWGSGAMMAMHDSGGKIVGFVKIFRDETENRQAQEELTRSREGLVEALRETEQARTEAEAANNAKDHFLAVLSHELRTPLTPALMTALVLQRRKDLDASMERGLEVISRNINTECKLIDDLLDITRISQGRIDVVREPINIQQTFLAALEIAKPDFESKEQILVLNLESGQAEFLGDATRLKQAFWNLLKNASKFTPRNGEIQVTTALENGAFRARITDSGQGIPSDKLLVIFDAFTQAEESIARKFGGLGLGLAIAKAIIDAHDGHITAKSEGEGRGASFTVELPLEIADTPVRSFHN